MVGVFPLGSISVFGNGFGWVAPYIECSKFAFEQCDRL